MGICATKSETDATSGETYTCSLVSLQEHLGAVIHPASRLKRIHPLGSNYLIEWTLGMRGWTGSIVAHHPNHFRPVAHKLGHHLTLSGAEAEDRLIFTGDQIEHLVTACPALRHGIVGFDIAHT